MVKTINGKRYTGAKGNAVVRELTGTKLSEARTKQLKYATKQRRRKKKKVSSAVEKRYKEVKKKWGKAFKSKGGKPNPAGYLPHGRIEDIENREGEEKALEALSNAEKYAEGIAYEKNVNQLAYFIQECATEYDSPELADVAIKVLERKDEIREKSILPAYEALYELNKGANPKDVAKELRKILFL